MITYAAPEPGLTPQATIQAGLTRPMSEILDAQIAFACAGLRFDAALAQTFPQYSRSKLSSWIKDGRVLIDGRVAKPRDGVSGGERVRVETIAEPVLTDVGEDIALEILLEDPDFLVINKPAGLVVHPGAGNRSGTLVNALLHREPALAAVPRAGVVHRLDKDTSGVMVVARTSEAHNALVKALAARDVRREYLALVFGKVIAGGTIDQPIGRHPTDRLRMAIVENGRPSVSHYRVVEKFPAHTLLRVSLETGRTHQIRVHLAHQRWGIVGDQVYGGGLRLPAGAGPELRTALGAFRRQALHAQSLSFAHPRTGAQVTVEAPVASDFEGLLKVLRGDAAARA